MWHLVVYGRKSETDLLRHRKVAQRATIEEVLAGARGLAAEVRKLDTPDDKIPHAKTWLNAARWADYGPVKAAATATTSASKVMIYRSQDREAFDAWTRYYQRKGHKGLLDFVLRVGCVAEVSRMPPNA